MTKSSADKKIMRQSLAMISNQVALVVCVTFAVFLVVVDYTLGVTLKSIHVGHLIAAISMVVALLVYQAIRGIKSEMGITLAYAYLHVVVHYALFFAIPLPSPYVVFVIGPALIMYYAFGTKAVVVSGLLSGVILAAQFIARNDLTKEHFGTVMVYYVIAMIILLYVVIFLKIAENERKSMERASRQVEIERSRLSTLVNNLSDAVIACDDTFTVLLHNPKALDLLNVEHTIRGKKLDSLVDLRDSEGAPIKLSSLADTDKHVGVYTSYRLYYSRNDFVNLYIGINQIRQGKEAPSGYVILLRDITKLKSLEEERNEFVYIMSHELRTPVTIVEGGISLAKAYNEKHDHKKVSEYLEKAHNQSLMLSSIVRSLSTLVNTEKGSEKIDVVEVEPRQFIERVKGAYHSEAHEKGLKLSAHCEADLRTVYTNEEYLYEIIQNLMTNAIKYTQTGTITISAKAHTKSYIAFSVSDTGIGISKSDQGHIFEKFWRSENYKTRKSGGTGLGLYLTKKLADKIGARIEVESALGEGSKFTLYVPIYDTQEV